MANQPEVENDEATRKNKNKKVKFGALRRLANTIVDIEDNTTFTLVTHQEHTDNEDEMAVARGYGRRAQRAMDGNHHHNHGGSLPGLTVTSNDHEEYQDTQLPPPFKPLKRHDSPSPQSLLLPPLLETSLHPSPFLSSRKVARTASVVSLVPTGARGRTGQPLMKMIVSPDGER